MFAIKIVATPYVIFLFFRFLFFRLFYRLSKSLDKTWQERKKAPTQKDKTATKQSAFGKNN
jgi:hypothetical protein